MYTGDFSGYKNSSGAVIPIYDPLTQCGTTGNANCPGGVAAASYSAGVARQLPRQHHSGQPDQPGFREDLGFSADRATQPAGAAVHAINNYSTTCTIGGNNNQENGRLDDTVTR